MTMDRATTQADTIPEAMTAADNARHYHAFIDKNRRTPYKCGICGRDIKHPCHQPALPGMMANTQTAEPVELSPDTWEPTKEEAQLSLF